jgi:hypothetical protein
MNFGIGRVKPALADTKLELRPGREGLAGHQASGFYYIPSPELHIIYTLYGWAQAHSFQTSDNSGVAGEEFREGIVKNPGYADEVSSQLTDSGNWACQHGILGLHPISALAS